MNSAELDKVRGDMAKTDNGFFSPIPILNYGRPACIITGHRSGGKSTGVGRYVLFNFIENGKKFLYIRRRRDELDKTKTKFFDSCIKIINGADLGYKIVYFDIKSNRYIMTVDKDGEHDYSKMSEEEKMTDIKKRAVDCGGAVSLAESQKIKSGYDFTDITTIIFDEFIAEHQTEYLGSYETPDVEYQNLISIFVSCDRGVGEFFRNETQLILIGNKANVYNPILLKWHVNKYLATSPDAKFISPKGEPGWVYQNVEPSQKYIEEAKHSNAILLMDEAERDYNLGNKTRSGNEGAEFVKPVPSGADYLRGIILGGVGYGIYDEGGIMYIGKYKKGKKVEAFDIASAYNGDADRIVTNWKDSPTMFSIFIRFCRKKLYFNNQETAKEFLQYLKFIPR